MAKYVTVQVTRKEPPAPAGAPGEHCKKCNLPLKPGELEQSWQVCPHCGYHYPLRAHARISLLADGGSVTFIAEELRPTDPLGFFDLRPYPERFAEAQLETGLTEALLAALCSISGHPVALGVMDFRFMGGSMGSVVGEKVTRALLKGADERKPVIIYTTSGGARMQEGIFSLMQMAKTSSAVAELAKAEIPYFVVLCDPTTGGVTASFAMLADVIIAEPGALIGFAGPRVIEGTIRQKLPEGFQKAEFQQDKGFVDIIANRKEQRHLLSLLIDLHKPFTACKEGA